MSNQKVIKRIDKTPQSLQCTTGMEGLDGARRHCMLPLQGHPTATTPSLPRCLDLLKTGLANHKSRFMTRSSSFPVPLCTMVPVDQTFTSKDLDFIRKII